MAGPVSPRGSATQTLAGALILLLLAAIAGTILHRQYGYVPTAEVQPPSDVAVAVADSQPAAANFIPEGMVPMTPGESFEPEKLSDKIDGRAELYLSAGFIMLSCQRFADSQDRDQWMEVFVYDMGAPANAYSVYSQQRRPDARDVDLAEHAYVTPNSLHLARGKYYVEVVQAGETHRLAEAALVFGRKFVAGTEPSGGKLEELALFPPANLRAGSISRATEDQFGIEGFDNVYTAIYEIDGKAVTAFMSRRKSAREAAGLAKAYQDYFLQFGGKPVASNSPADRAKTIEIDGVYKCAFSRGALLAGVHEAPDAASAEAVAAELHSRLLEVGD
jgi:hypothetical protein